VAAAVIVIPAAAAAAAAAAALVNISKLCYAFQLSFHKHA
jgi:hypothetical protein